MRVTPALPITLPQGLAYQRRTHSLAGRGRIQGRFNLRLVLVAAAIAIGLGAGTLMSGLLG